MNKNLTYSNKLIYVIRIKFILNTLYKLIIHDGFEHISNYFFINSHHFDYRFTISGDFRKLLQLYGAWLCVPY